MEIAQYLPFLDSDKIGTYSFIAILIIGNIVTIIIAMIQAKPPVQIEMMKQAMARQDQLDKSQKEMTANLQREINEVRAEAKLRFERAEKDRIRYEELFEKYVKMSSEYQEILELLERIQSENQELLADNEEYLRHNEELGLKNTELTERLEQMQKEIDELRQYK